MLSWEFPLIQILSNIWDFTSSLHPTDPIPQPGQPIGGKDHPMGDEGTVRNVEVEPPLAWPALKTAT